MVGFEDIVKDVVKWIGYAMAIFGPILSIIFEYPYDIPEVGTKTLFKILLIFQWINFIFFLAIFVYITKVLSTRRGMI